MVSDPRAKTDAPAHTVLAAVFQVRDGRLDVLLWERALDPCAGCWSLPGGELAADETLERSIRRHLAAKVDVRELSHLEQLETLSDPARNPLRRELATARRRARPPARHALAPGRRAARPRLRPRARAAGGARPAPRQALVHEHRLRAGAGDVHDLGAPRPLPRGDRPRDLGDEPPARAATPRRPEGDGSTARAGPGGRAPGRRLPLRATRVPDHGPVRRFAAPTSFHAPGSAAAAR